MPFAAVSTAATDRDRSVDPCPTCRRRCAFGVVGAATTAPAMRAPATLEVRQLQPRRIALAPPFRSVGRGHDGAYGLLSVQPCRSVRFIVGGASAQGRYPASEGAHDVQHLSQEAPPMKANPTVSSGRQRCMGCGHPNSEHLGREECTVPQCGCPNYQQPKKR